MDPREQSKAGETSEQQQHKNNTNCGDGIPLSLSQLLLSRRNPLVSSAKVEQTQLGKERPASPISKYEFVQIIPQNHEKNESHKKMRRVLDLGDYHIEASSSQAVKRAKEVEANLSGEHPTFIKVMRRSNVLHKFFMYLPREFCNLHLPTRAGALVVLEDETGRQFKTKLLRSHAFSKGWKQFSVAQKLQEGDVLIFHLVRPFEFKVHIVRKSDFDEVDEAPNSQNSGEINAEMKRTGENPNDDPSVVSLNISRESVKVNNSKTANCKSLGNRDVESSLESFKIIANEHTIDSEIPDHIRTSYFDLCCSRNSCPHQHLIKGLSTKFVASIISETMNIANMIRDSEITTPPEDITNWSLLLEGFEVLGMDVGFIRARLIRLLGLALDYNAAIDSKNYKEARSEGARIEEAISKLESKIEELRDLKRKVDQEMKITYENMEKCRIKYKEEADAPW